MFARILLSVFWLALGVCNGYMLLKRVTPFNAQDLKAWSEGLAVEEGKWVKVKEVTDISGLTHGIGWCAPQQGACKLTLNVKDGIIQEFHSLPDTVKRQWIRSQMAESFPRAVPD